MRVRLAIVDDHPLVREGIAALLGDVADDAVTVEVSYAGESLATALAGAPDVVLLDIDLGPDTPRLIDSIADCRLAGAQVLLISASAASSTILAGMRAGAVGFVPKRAPTKELRAAVLDAVRGEIHLSVDLATVFAGDADRPALSAQELSALRLYASGLKMTAVGRRMGVSPHTVKEYLDRVRTKYAAAGRPVRTRTDLYAAAQRDGLLESGD